MDWEQLTEAVLTGQELTRAPEVEEAYQRYRASQAINLSTGYHLTLSPFPYDVRAYHYVFWAPS